MLQITQTLLLIFLFFLIVSNCFYVHVPFLTTHVKPIHACAYLPSWLFKSDFIYLFILFVFFLNSPPPLFFGGAFWGAFPPEARAAPIDGITAPDLTVTPPSLGCQEERRVPHQALLRLPWSSPLLNNRCPQSKEQHFVHIVDSDRYSTIFWRAS